MPPKVALPTTDIESRQFFVGEVRAADQNGTPVIEMTPAVFNQYSEDLGGFVEIIEPGFFDDVMDDDVRALWNHNMDKVLGRTLSKTLEISQTDTGLQARCYPPVTPPEVASFALDAMVMVKRGDVTQGSFSFRVKRIGRGDAIDGDEWYVLGNQVVRRLKKGGCRELYDVSPVTYPAYEATSVSADTRARFDDFRSKQGQPPAAPGGAPEAGADAAQIGLEAEHRKHQLDLMRMELD